MCNNDLCTVQDQVCTLLGIHGMAVDDKIEIIIDSVANRLKNLLGGVSIIPQQLMYIVTEVSVIRFNRIGSEGMSSHSVEGESISFSDNDFVGFMDEIEAYLELTVNSGLKTTGASISQEMVDAFISSYEVCTMGNKCTVVRAILRNGFEIVESSACVSEENYDEEMGTQICLSKIKDKVWLLLGFLLQTAIHGVKEE